MAITAYDEDDGIGLVPDNEGQAGTTEEVEPVGPFQGPDDLLVATINRWIRESAKASSERRKARRKEWDALASDQWDEADIKRMDDGKRARLTLNLLHTMLAAVEGEERTDRQEIKFYGQGAEDDQTAATMNKLLKWVMDQCGGEFSLSQMFKHGAAVGEGWVGPEVDYLDDPDGKITLVHVDEDEMFPDPQSVDPAGRDGRRLQRATMKDEDEIKARWPAKFADIQAAHLPEGDYASSETDGKGFPDIYLTPGKSDGPKLYCGRDRQWLVAETWWTQIEPGYVVVNEQTGELDQMDEEQFEKAKADREAAQAAFMQLQLAGRIRPIPVPGAMPGLPGSETMPEMPKPLDATQRPIRRFYQAFTCGDVLLEKRPSPVPKLTRYPYVPFRAYKKKSTKEWYGLLFLCLDVQRQHNVEQSAIIQLMQQLPHASWMAPKGAYGNKQDWEQRAAQAAKMLEYNAQRGKPEQIQTPPIPRHLVEMAASRQQSMRDISGINTELTGQRGSNDAGVVMEMRKKAATTVLATLFDHNRMSKIEVGRVLLAYIQTFIPVGRKVRTLGPEGSEFVHMTEDMSIGKFDLKIEETNSTVNDRIATLTVLQTTLPQMIDAGVPIPPEFVDLLPIEPKIRDAMKRMIAWQLTLKNALPPPDWQPGMPIPPAPLPALPGAGAMPPVQPPAGPPAPAQ